MQEHLLFAINGDEPTTSDHLCGKDFHNEIIYEVKTGNQMIHGQWYQAIILL